MNSERLAVRNAACALVFNQSGGNLPLERRLELEAIVREHLQLQRDPTEHELHMLSGIEVKDRVEGYMSPEQILVTRVLMHGADVDDEKLSTFVQGWRRLLLDTLQPTHLPPEWSVESRVVPAARSAETLTAL